MTMDEKTLIDLILKRLHFESLEMGYTVNETVHHHGGSTSATSLKTTYRSRGEDFFVTSEFVTKALVDPALPAWKKALSWVWFVIRNKRFPSNQAFVIGSVSCVGGQWRQLVAIGEPGHTLGKMHKRGVLGDGSLVVNQAMHAPTPRQLWEKVGSVTWSVLNIRSGVVPSLGLPLDEFLRTPGKTKIWDGDKCVVLTHEIPVPPEVDNRAKACLDIYVDEQGFVRRIDNVNRLWDFTEEAWAAVPGLGAWEDAREVIFSVVFEDIGEDAATGAQIPLHVRVSLNYIDCAALNAAREKWHAECRSAREIRALALCVSTIPQRRYEIAVDRAALRINPPLRDGDIELSFPEGTLVDGMPSACACRRR